LSKKISKPTKASDLVSNFFKIFDVYEGTNIPENKKSIALNVVIQSLEKTLNEEDLNKINQLIISTVETKTDAKIRS
jgi:phenylalanyl-tRNA synthetase beta chain